MADFQSPTDLKHNRGLIADPSAFAREADAASWLFLCGEEFAAMEGGMSRRQIAALDEVLVRAEADEALFIASDELKAWVAQGLEEFS